MKIATLPPSQTVSPSRQINPARVTQSPIGYPTMSQNTMITLNNKNVKEPKGYMSLSGKQLLKAPKGRESDDSASPMQFSKIDHGQTKQNYTRQSPVELPSSSNTSKQSNSQTATGQHSIGHVSNQHLGSELRQMSLQLASHQLQSNEGLPRQIEPNEQSQYNKVVKDQVMPFKDTFSAAHTAYAGEPTGRSTCKFCQGVGPMKFNTSITDPNSISNQGTERVVINLDAYNLTGSDAETLKKSDSYRKLSVNKRIQQSQEEQNQLKQKLAKAEQAMLKTQAQL